MAEHTPDRRLVLIGGGGHALVVAEAAQNLGWQIAGFYDDDPASTLASRTGLPRLGGLREAAGEVRIVIAVGGLELRRTVIDALREQRLIAATVCAPGSHVAPSASIAGGVFIGPGAIVHSHASIAAHGIINSGAIVEHECMLAENVHIAPGAALGGRVTVGADTLIGLGSRTLPGIRIGHGCTIGSGAVVIRDVPDGATVVGVPAREKLKAQISKLK
ncbi:MAG: acetyltransferase [Phycisphaerales bacterium]|nr:acetyltransferase [Phycisphaerales bacterium]